MSGRDQTGIALITTIIILLVLFVLGTTLIILATMEFKISKSHTAYLQALYVADAGIQHVVAEQNDLTLQPRYLFDHLNYDTLPLVNPLLDRYELTNPMDGSLVGIAQRQIVNDKNPLYDPPPYRIRSEAQIVAVP